MTWHGRLRTLAAMAQLLLAVALVRFVPMGQWRARLGRLDDGPFASISDPDPDQSRVARRCAWHVARAAGHFPFTVKCLPQAMVLQWQLRRREIASRLVIAKLGKAQAAGVQDPFHAWVELGGVMLLGICERSDYAVLMTFSNEPG